MAGRIDGKTGHTLMDAPGQRVKELQHFYLVIE